MTWRDAIGKAASYLDGKSVPEGALAAEHLAARLLGCGRGLLAPSLDREIGERHLEAMRRGMRRLVAGEPIQYVIGEWDFRHLTLSCDRRALIPRPETEGLVSLVLDFLRARPPSERPPFVVDVGTGTGAIALSIADEFKGDAAIVGTDVSEDAIALAKANAERTGLASHVGFAVMDGLDDFDEPGVIDVIVSNPPSIASSAIAALDPRVRDFEPRIALDGGESGLDFYDRYLSDSMNLLSPGGMVFFEIGDTQGAAVARLMGEYGFSDVEVRKDLAGRDRYASGAMKF